MKRPQWKERDGMEMLKVSELVFDFNLYPRAQVDFEHVQRIVDAMEAGVVFPPIVACRKSKRIVDGAHRSKAVERILGPTGEVAVILKDYATPQQLFLDAVRYNSEHGLALSSRDRFRIMETAESMKISATQTAAAMRMSVHAAGKLTVATPASLLSVRRPIVTPTPKFSTPVPVAESSVMSPEPAFVPPAAPDPLPLVNGLIDWLENYEVDTTDQRLLRRVESLQSLLNKLAVPA